MLIEAVRAFVFMYAYARNLEALQQVPPKLSVDIAVRRNAADRLLSEAPDNGFIPESTAKEILSAYGLLLDTFQKQQSFFFCSHLWSVGFWRLFTHSF